MIKEQFKNQNYFFTCGVLFLAFASILFAIGCMFIGLQEGEMIMVGLFLCLIAGMLLSKAVRAFQLDHRNRKAIKAIKAKGA